MGTYNSCIDMNSIEEEASYELKMSFYTVYLQKLSSESWLIEIPINDKSL